MKYVCFVMDLAFKVAVVALMYAAVDAVRGDARRETVVHLHCHGRTCNGKCMEVITGWASAGCDGKIQEEEK